MGKHMLGKKTRKRQNTAISLFHKEGNNHGTKQQKDYTLIATSG
jgi:hypothetical protein